jgi:hypothetical protein
MITLFLVYFSFLISFSLSLSLFQKKGEFDDDLLQQALDKLYSENPAYRGRSRNSCPSLQDLDKNVRINEHYIYIYLIFFYFYIVLCIYSSTIYIYIYMLTFIYAEVAFPDATWKKHFVRGKAARKRHQCKTAESPQFMFFIR